MRVYKIKELKWVRQRLHTECYIAETVNGYYDIYRFSSNTLYRCSWFKNSRITSLGDYATSEDAKDVAFAHYEKQLLEYMEVEDRESMLRFVPCWLVKLSLDLRFLLRVF